MTTKTETTKGFEVQKMQRADSLANAFRLVTCGVFVEARTVQEFRRCTAPVDGMWGQNRAVVLGAAKALLACCGCEQPRNLYGLIERVVHHTLDVTMNVGMTHGERQAAVDSGVEPQYHTAARVLVDAIHGLPIHA